jgi:O-antigen ligase
MRVFLMGAIALSFVAQLLTLCRGAVICTILEVVIIAAASHRRWTILGAMVFTFVIASTVLPVDFLGRLATLSKGRSDSSISDRSLLSMAAVQMGEDYFPLGVGIGNYRQYMSDYLPSHLTGINSHDTYLDLFAECGIIGVLLMLGMMASLFTTLRFRFTAVSQEDWHQSLLLALKAAVFVIIIAFIFEDMAGFPIYWMVFMLISLRPLIFERAAPETVSVMVAGNPAA